MAKLAHYPSMDDLIRSHRDLRAAVRLSGRLIEKRLPADPKAQKLIRLLKRVLKESRQVEKAQTQ
ncbi:MAG TPA: hypothetical protein VEX68_05005 [Bryobacteraceae bacterium]|nr:hypothetical protein [Bryobacteraceae bacterium]